MWTNHSLRVANQVILPENIHTPSFSSALSAYLFSPAELLHIRASAPPAVHIKIGDNKSQHFFICLRLRRIKSNRYF